MNSEECKHESVKTVMPTYQDDTIIGFKDLVLHDAVEQFSCRKCGEQLATYIPDMRGLECAVAVARVMLPVRLKGHEIRFLRKTVGLAIREMTNVLQVREETISRWENGREAIGPQSEKLLRLVVGVALADFAGATSFDAGKIIEMDLRGPARPDIKIVFACRRISLVHRLDWRRATEEIGWRMEPKVAA